ncbi:hypothetical protein CPC08DRAFT_823650 [Agrocybe pediades]|nr:hypothetical protein CPC08DRAFT_823650 [Agrocybe pediades]
MPTQPGPTRTVKSSDRQVPYTATRKASSPLFTVFEVIKQLIGRHETRNERRDTRPASGDSDFGARHELPNHDYGSTNLYVHLSFAHVQEPAFTSASLPLSSWSSLSAMFDYKTWDDSASPSPLRTTPPQSSAAAPTVTLSPVPVPLLVSDTRVTPESDGYVRTPSLSPPSSSNSTPSTSLSSLPTTPPLWEDFTAPEVEVAQETTRYSPPSASSMLLASSWTTEELASTLVPSDTMTWARFRAPEYYGRVAIPPPPQSLSPAYTSLSPSPYTIPSNDNLRSGIWTLESARSSVIPSLSPSPTTIASSSLRSLADTHQTSFTRDWSPVAFSSSAYSSTTNDVHQTDRYREEISLRPTVPTYKLQNHPSIAQAGMGETKNIISGKPRILPPRSPCHSLVVEPVKANNQEIFQRTDRSKVVPSTQVTNAGSLKDKGGRKPKPYKVVISPALNYNHEEGKCNRDVRRPGFMHFYNPATSS